MADVKKSPEEEPAVGFDQTNGLAGNLVGDNDETVEAHETDEESNVGSLWTEGVQRGATTAHEFSSSDESDDEGSDGEEPI